MLVNLLNDSWHIDSALDAPGSDRASRFIVMLVRRDETLSLLVLDGPVVRDVLPAGAALLAGEAAPVA